VIAAIVLLGVVAAGLIGVLVVLLRMQAAERSEWSEERMALLDRVIAKHAGEVIAMERIGKPRNITDTPRPEAVGLG
jgi:hypothetical protein